MKRTIALAVMIFGAAACNSSTGPKNKGDMAMNINHDLAGFDQFMTDAAAQLDGAQPLDGATVDLPPPPVLDLAGVDMTPPVGCGDGTRKAGEECDDGNLVNLDGCSAQCKFEQVQRFTDLTIPATGAGTCTNDAIGAALGSSANILKLIIITPRIKNGVISILTQFSGLTDLTGQGASQTINMGLFGGTPKPSPAAYNGTKDLDYRYTADVAGLDVNREPTTEIPATIGASAAGAIAAGPGNFKIALGIANVTLYGATITATASTPNKPIIAKAAAPPGHLTTENVDPTLMTFSTMSGSVCGNISAADLNAAPLGATVAGQCSDQGFTATNTYLDAILEGCSGGLATITATQPDGSAGSTTPPGAGAPYKLTFDATSKQVTGCTDKTKATVSLADCLQAATYSTYLTFKADRVIPRNN